MTVATDERRPVPPQSAPSNGADDASWTAVLAAVEADLARTQQLMATPAESVHSFDSPGAPAQAMLPAIFRQHSEASWATLPAPDTMPPVPVELTERIHALRAQIVALQAEIKAEMTQWQAECTTRRTSTTPAATVESYYVDRLA